MIPILIIGMIVAYGVFISTFDLFGEPDKEIPNVKSRHPFSNKQT